MRDFSHDISALALNTAMLGHNLDGHGAGWPPERVIDACARRGFGGFVFWSREVGSRSREIGERVRAAGMAVAGLCRTPFLAGPGAGSDDEVRASIDMAAGLEARVLTVVTGGTEPGSKGLRDSRMRLTEKVAAANEYAGTMGVRLAPEPLIPMFGGNRTVLMTCLDAVHVCEAVNAPNLGIEVDVYHFWWDSLLDSSLARAGRERILGFHLCDWLANSRHMVLDRGMMGDGVADLKSLRKSVEGTGYDGYCDVEIFSANDWWQRDPDEVLDVAVERFRTVCQDLPVGGFLPR
ncbi:MAG: sugar phosphate isomerase/epimerase [Rhodobacteraceae bacterium]|nr:sugar phosphate isomerase/epimerase [Paracoccaceae bacterium]